MIMMQEFQEMTAVPPLNQLLAQADEPDEIEGVLSRLATHNGSTYCLAAVTTDAAANKLMRISWQTYEALLFGGLMRRRVTCRRDHRGVWTIDPEAR